MAFGDTGVKDNFNRSNSGDLGTDWTVNWWFTSTETSDDIVSNQAGDSGLYGIGGEYYNVSAYGPNCEVFSTINQIGNNDGDVYILGLRLTTPGNSTTDGYRVTILNVVSGDETRILRIDNTVATLLGAAVTSINWAAGYKCGLEANGSTLTLYADTGAGWASVTTRDDDTYDSAGYLGIGLYREGGTQLLIDDFGGGTLAGGVSVSLDTASATASGIKNISTISVRLDTG